MPGIGEFGFGFQNAMYGLRKHIAQYAVRYTRGPIDPVITVDPTAGGITYGMLLSGSILSGGSAVNPVGAPVTGIFVWEDDTQWLNAGTHSPTVQFIPDDTDTYNIVDTTATLTVLQRPITVSAHDKSKDYGTSDPALTYSVTAGSLASGDSFSGSLTRDSGSDAGTYTIRQDSLTIVRGSVNVIANYDLTFNNGTLTINKITPTIYTYPSAGNLLHGNAYTDSTLSGGSVSVAGHFDWVPGQTPSTVSSPSGSQTFNSSGTWTKPTTAHTYQARFVPTNSNYNTVTFNRTFFVSRATVNLVLVGAGGGGGSCYIGGMGLYGSGGGGAGQYRTVSGISVTSISSASVAVGGGGSGSSGYWQRGSTGGTSSAFGYSAVGGGGGGSSGKDSGDIVNPQGGGMGASGGGGGGNTVNGRFGSGGSASAGNIGASAYNVSGRRGGGGGGAGSAGNYKDGGSPHSSGYCGGGAGYETSGGSGSGYSSLGSGGAAGGSSGSSGKNGRVIISW